MQDTSCSRKIVNARSVHRRIKLSDLLIESLVDVADTGLKAIAIARVALAIQCFQCMLVGCYNSKPAVTTIVLLDPNVYAWLPWWPIWNVAG
jgi:hypothetical protein